MSLRKSPTLTPALLAANRRNAQKATGPRTERGKNWSRVNRLRSGMRSRPFQRLMDAVLAAMPGEVRQTARALLPPYLAQHPLYIEFVEGIVETDLQLSAEAAASRRRFEEFQKTRPQGRPPDVLAGVNRRAPDSPRAASDASVPDNEHSTPRKMTFQPGMSLKTNESVVAKGCASGVPPATPAASAGSSLSAQQKTTFQPGMSLKTNESVVTSRHQNGVSAGVYADSDCAGKMPALHKTTFQPGMSLKTNESDTASDNGSGLSHEPPTPSAGAGKMPAQQKTTFQPGMSLKTNESVSPNRHERRAARAVSSNARRASRLPTRRHDQFDDGDPIDPNEPSDEDIATILDKSRKAGFSQSFFDWVEREILSKRSVPSRNVVDKQAPGK